jgi:hypothetical protein
MPLLRGFNHYLTTKPRARALGYEYVAPAGAENNANSYVELTLSKSLATGAHLLQAINLKEIRAGVIQQVINVNLNSCVDL